MKVGRVDGLREAELLLSGAEISERAVEGLLHHPVDPTGDLEFPGSGGGADLQTVEADPALIIDRGRVDAARRQRVRRDQVASALLGDADELLLERLRVQVREGGLVV